MKTTILNFGGFYCSIHSELAESMVKMYEDNDGENVIEFENYSKLYAEYSKRFVSFLNELMGCKLKFISLESPRYYNYSTDNIVCNYAKKDFAAIKKYAKENDLQKDIENHIKDITTLKDGYWPFYEYSEVFLHENEDILIQCYLDVIIENSTENWINYYDIENVYEIIYSL